MLFNKKSFTLIELIIVVMIVGILASIAVPAILNLQEKAILSEAISAMGAIRSAERTYYVEYGTYCQISFEYVAPPSGDDRFLGIGIADSELNGVYFSRECYNVSPDGTIICDPARSSAPKSYIVEDWEMISMDADGNISRLSIVFHIQ